MQICQRLQICSQLLKRTLNSNLHFLCSECKHRENEPRMNIAVLHVIICAGYLIEALT